MHCASRNMTYHVFAEEVDPAGNHVNQLFQHGRVLSAVGEKEFADLHNYRGTAKHSTQIGSVRQRWIRRLEMNLFPLHSKNYSPDFPECRNGCNRVPQLNVVNLEKVKHGLQWTKM